MKRPSLAERTTSTNSLSSSNKPAQHKPPAHIVKRSGHTRNLSHGKNLSKLVRNTSGSNLVTDATRNHQRKRSGPSEAQTSSPKPSPIKRNSSNVVLTRNALSQGSLRKNHSATHLPRNTSQPILKKSALHPPEKAIKQKLKKKPSTFELGDDSDDADVNGEEEAEWEDSSASPELTRNNSSILSQSRPPTSEPGQEPERTPEIKPGRPRPASTEFQLRKPNQSAPNLAPHSDSSPAPPPRAPQPPTSPALLSQNQRSSRAPPAMSSILAHANHQLTRNDSSKSFDHITHEEAASSKDNLKDTAHTPTILGNGTSSSGDGGVSHFLSTSTPGQSVPRDEDADYDSPSNFLPNYHPQPSSSPEQKRGAPKPRQRTLPSRTQMQLDLQRRETMRSGTSTPSTPPGSDHGLTFGSSASLHSRAGSHGRRDRSVGMSIDEKAIKRDYEAATKQLSVVRRFRNPVLESLNRLKERGVLATGGATTPASTKSGRPPSRRGLNSSAALTNGSGKQMSRSFEEQRPLPMVSRPSSRGRGAGRVHFQRQGSHDDIGLSRSKGSADGEDLDREQEEEAGISAEEALLRRMWESRDVYDSRERIRV